MSKIIKNNTGSNVFLADVGVTIPASGQYVIPPTEYWLWAASSDVVTKIGDSTLTVNDGSVDLTISDGVDLVKGIFQKHRLIGGTDSTIIGNVLDKLKVHDPDVLSAIVNLTTNVFVSNIFKFNEASITSRNETDFTTPYTVASGKNFYLTSFAGSYDAQSAMYVRLKKQTNGSGPFFTIFRLNMMPGGQGDTSPNFPLGNGVLVGTAGDVFKITVESTIAKGTVFAAFTGAEL